MNMPSDNSIANLLARQAADLAKGRNRLDAELIKAMKHIRRAFVRSLDDAIVRPTTAKLRTIATTNELSAAKVRELIAARESLDALASPTPPTGLNA
jgi:hypothetical protein